jgi:hypothetical protein
MAFDPLNFTSNAGKTIGSLATQSASAVTSGLSGNFINGLSKTGLSLDSLKSVASDKMDSLNSSLSGVAGYRITQQDLFKSRSASSSEPITAVNQSRESQQTKQERFPLSLSDTEYMLIEFSKYDRPSPLMPAKFNTEYSVSLPLPRDLSEQHSVRINPQDTGLLGMFTDQIKSIMNGVTGTEKRSSSDLAEDSVGIMYAGAKNLASSINVAGISGEQAAETAGQFLKAVPNPHISVFFNGVDMRQPMEFSWLFTARNVTESNKIKNIIKQFKKRTLPAVSTGAQNLMSYPQMVRLTLFPWGEQFIPGSEWSGTMPMYKLGLISAIHVNYSPNGLSFFNDDMSSPVFVVFSFTFQEIEVITGKDYGNDDGPTLAKDAMNGLGKVKDYLVDKGSKLLGGE